jgi:hypothetical protein
MAEHVRARVISRIYADYDSRREDMVPDTMIWVEAGALGRPGRVQAYDYEGQPLGPVPSDALKYDP